MPRFWRSGDLKSRKDASRLQDREAAIGDGYAMTERRINLRGLKCPLPALRTRKALAGLSAGDVIVVECTDPLTAIDIPHLVRETGDALESSSQEGGLLSFRIRKA
jgi:tRNA 2-thiouridine synthesizing protein A